MDHWIVTLTNRLMLMAAVNGLPLKEIGEAGAVALQRRIASEIAHDVEKHTGFEMPEFAPSAGPAIRQEGR